MRFRFPFRRDNRRPDGFWDAPDATDDNITGTSVDPYDPVWPRWKQVPPDHGEGEFISEEPFFDIDEIRQQAEFYPPGTPLVDKNFGGNPASRQRIGDMPGGNLSRRRLLVAYGDNSDRRPLVHMSQASDHPGVPAREMLENPEGNLSQRQLMGHDPEPTPVQFARDSAGDMPMPWGRNAQQLPLLYNQTRANRDFPGWAVNWKFDRVPDNAFIMQKVQSHEETETGEIINPETRWEFWPVSKYADETDLQRDARKPRILKPGEDPHTPDDTLGQDRRLGQKSRAGNRMVVHTEASLWFGEKIPDAAKVLPRSRSRHLRTMTTDPGLQPDPTLSIRRGYSRPLK